MIALLALCATSALAAQSAAVRTNIEVRPDSAFTLVRSRLTTLGYRIDTTDPEGRRLVVRLPKDDTPVEIRITANGDSSTIAFTPLAGGMAAMVAVMAVTHDATVDAAPATAVGDSGELPKSRWRPELYVTPGGRLWMARDGLYHADSARGSWRQVLAGARNAIDVDMVGLGLNMAFVGEDTALIGIAEMMRDSSGPVLYRSTDRGASWTPLATGDLASVDAIAAVGPSVWAFGNRWDHDNRRGTFLRSADAGRTWQRVALPPQLNDVTGVYRVSERAAYVATNGAKQPFAFWRTTDNGDHWTGIPTPHDQHLHTVPSYGVRLEQIATVGDWLVVREYGAVFVARADSMRWRPLAHAEHIAADRAGDRLFVITDSLTALMLDKDLRPVWQSTERIAASDANDLEQVVAFGGTGYVSTSHSLIYEARDGTLRRVTPSSR